MNELRQAQEAEEPYFDEAYPRLATPEPSSPIRKSVPEFLEDFHKLADDEVTLMGRIRAKRVSGKGLIFIDLVNEFKKVQIMLNKKSIFAGSQKAAGGFSLFRNMIQVGDHICELRIYLGRAWHIY